MIGQRLPYLPPILTSSEHQNSEAVLTHQLSPDIRKGIALFEGSVLQIRAVLKIKMTFESRWTGSDRGNRMLGETVAPLGMKIWFVLGTAQRVVCLGGAVGEYCTEKCWLFIATAMHNTFTHCVGKTQSSEWQICRCA